MAPKTPFSLNALSRALALFALAAGALQASAAGTSFEYKKLTRTLVVTSPSTSSSTSGNTGNSGAPTTPVAPTLTGDLSTHSLAFDAKAVGTSQTKSLLLSNTGTGALTLGTPSVSDAGFTASTSCSTTLAVGADCQTDVTFTPPLRRTVHGNPELSVQRGRFAVYGSPERHGAAG